MRERKFKYRWERTWQDRPDDFTCWDGDLCIGRVKLHDTGPARIWTWFMSIDMPVNLAAEDGACADRDTACHALEAAYGRVK